MADAYHPRPFTPEQEARIRQIIRDEIDADRAKGIGAVADAASEVIRRQTRTNPRRVE